MSTLGPWLLIPLSTAWFQQLSLPGVSFPPFLCIPPAVAMPTTQHRLCFPSQPSCSHTGPLASPRMCGAASHLTTQQPALSLPSSPKSDLPRGHTPSSQSEAPAVYPGPGALLLWHGALTIELSCLCHEHPRLTTTLSTSSGVFLINASRAPRIAPGMG